MSLPPRADETDSVKLGFVIPLASQPDKCHDLVTPNDMHTSSVCAASGGMMLFGGYAGVMWLLIRAITLHLQICWGTEDGRFMKAAALTAGWGVPILCTTLAVVLSGVSFRFGDSCYINHVHSMETTWIPLLVLIGIAVLISFATLGYCIKVYVTMLNDDSRPSHGGSYAARRNSVSTAATILGPREVYRRTRDAVRLQWRGIAVVLVMMADVIFFSVVFVFQDEVVRSVTHRPRVAEDWGLCLIRNGGQKSACLGMVSEHVMSHQIIVAVLILLSVSFFILLFFFPLCLLYLDRSILTLR